MALVNVMLMSACIVSEADKASFLANGYVHPHRVLSHKHIAEVIFDQKWMWQRSDASGQLCLN